MEEMKMDKQQEQAEVQESVPAKPRNYTFMGIAALYLIYLGYELCMGFVQGKEGSGIGFFLMGVVFIGVGIAVVIYAVKGSRKRHAIIKAAEAAEAAAAEEAKQNAVSEKIEEGTVPAKKMSIAERARLANRHEDEDSDEQEEA